MDNVLDLTKVIDAKVDFRKLIVESNQQPIEVRFFKRSGGVIRNMKCKYGVTEGLKGTGAAYDANAKGLIVVFDTEANKYKSIGVESILQVIVNGVTYRHFPEGKDEKPFNSGS